MKMKNQTTIILSVIFHQVSFPFYLYTLDSLFFIVLESAYENNGREKCYACSWKQQAKNHDDTVLFNIRYDNDIGENILLCVV